MALVDAMERLEPDAPVYAIVQPDGSSVTLDLSTPDAFCDFAMEMRFDDGKQRSVSVYHTGEPSLFIEILRSWVYAATPTEIVAGMAWARIELDATTRGRSASEDSKNDFDFRLREIEALGRGVHAVEPSRHKAEDPSFTTLTPNPTGVTLTAERPGEPPMSCRVPAADLPAVLAGMIWRSFKERGTALSRLNTATYLEALDTFEKAVCARVGE